MNKNYCITLAFNIPVYVRVVTELLYAQNKNFEHIIFDLGFPLSTDDVVIPHNVEKSKEENSLELKAICRQFGSKYVKMDNRGVSQNWSAAIRELVPDDSDIIIGVDPDEFPQSFGWVDGMRKALSEVSVVSLFQRGLERIILPGMYHEKIVDGERIWIMKAVTNWALIGISGAFLNEIKEIPVPRQTQIYGNIESELLKLMNIRRKQWCILPDKKVTHVNPVWLYRQWKDFSIFDTGGVPQIQFEEWLVKQKAK